MIDLDELYARLRDTPLPPERGDRPPTFLEREIWRKAQGAPRSFACVAQAWTLRGALQIGPFRDAVAITQRRHDATWTSFPAVADDPVARLDPARCAPLREMDATSTEEARRLLFAEHAAGFDLGAGPLVRYVLIRLSPEEHHLMLLAHHIVCDFRALVLLSRDVMAAYRALRAGQAPTLPPVHLHNRALSAWQRGWYEGEMRAAYERFWQRQRGDHPARPTLRRMRAADDERRLGPLANLITMVDPISGAQLAARGLERGHSSATLLLGALAMLLYEEGAEDGVVLGVISANRRRETLRLVCNLAVMLPLRIHVEAKLSFEEIVERVQASLTEVTAYQDAPPTASRAHDVTSEPYRVVFNSFMVSNGRPFELEGICSQRITTLPPRSHLLYDIIVNVMTFQDDDTMKISLDYNADLVPESAARDFAERYRRLLERLATTRSGTVATLLT